MIKLEITDLETASEDVLRETGRYLLALSNRAHVELEPVELEGLRVGSPASAAEPEPVEPDTSKEPHAYFVFPPEPVLIDIPQAPAPVVDIVPMPSEIFSKPAPAPIPPAQVTPAPSVDLDVHGMPWDIRIHARTKTKMKDGSWKKLRGVGPLVVKTVEAQLLTIQNIPAPPAVPPAPEAPAEAVAPGFSDLMTLVTKAITEGKLKRDQVTAVLKPFGIPSLPLIATRLDLIPAVIEALTEIVNAPF